VPAYLNVELVHPAPDLIKFSKLDTLFVEGTPEFWAQKLREYCNDGRIDFDEMSLEQDMMWFRENRVQLMESIPSLSGRKSSGKIKQKKMQLKHREELVHALPPANNEWVKTDIYQLENCIMVKVDLPNLVPQVDFHVQCFGSRLLIKGERKSDNLEGFSVLQSQRPHGKFEVFFDLPVTADMNNSEQSFHNGVLSIKFGLRDKAVAWRSLTVSYDPSSWQ
jgi:HSP20 family molecular chaperone IbpA